MIGNRQNRDEQKVDKALIAAFRNSETATISNNLECMPDEVRLRMGEILPESFRMRQILLGSSAIC